MELILITYVLAGGYFKIILHNLLDDHILSLNGNGNTQVQYKYLKIVPNYSMHYH